MADEEGGLGEVGFEVSERALERVPRPRFRRFVVWSGTICDEKDLDRWVEDLVVRPRDPLLYECTRLGVPAKQLGGLGETGNYATRNSVLASYVHVQRNA